MYPNSLSSFPSLVEKYTYKTSMQTILLYERVKYLPITKENKPVIEGCVLGRLLNLTF